MKQDIPLIGPILNRLIGTRNDRFVKRYTQRVEAISRLEPQIRVLTDSELRGRLQVFRAKIDAGTKADDLLVDAFAVAREAMDRAVGIRNIFNPLHAERFDASRLPAEARAMYEDVKARIAACEPMPPEGEFLGCTEPQPGWLQVEIPPALYEAVRAIYPESRPPFRARPFDVQLIGAMVLYQGKISEMKTGEGKTIVGPLACYLACVERIKVHVVTVNDYLVQRDRDWTYPYFHALGMTVGAIHPMHMQPEDMKRRMYRCDIVYGTTSEFGFDYLRDNMKRSAEQQVQKVRQMAIVDEVDSILIDEARTPLIISGSAHEDRPRYELADQLARHLVQKQRPWQAADDAVEDCKKLIKGLEGDIRNAREKDKIPALQARLGQAQGELPKLEGDRAKHTQFYEVQLERKAVHVTHDGVAEAQRVANVGSFYVGENMDVPHLLEQALRAHVVYQRDRDYIVGPQENPNTGRVEPSVIIVDVNTGRPMVGRQWSDGLHQAIECKEAVPIKQENQTVATITIQNFFKMYKRLAGMTGTADTEAQEFHDIYRLDVVSIPTNKKVTRRDYDDLVFLTGKDKWQHIVDEIKAFHDVGRPVLVGTTSVEKSEMLAQMLQKKHGIKHEVLNAKQHEREAHIVENAGQLGQVMIATNMAGRGTDIKLGPITREALLRHWQLRELAPGVLTVDANEEALREAIYRKIGAAQLGIPKREVEGLNFQELELRLLRHWTTSHTWLTDGSIEKASAEELRTALDSHGRFVLHRIRWFGSIEDLGGLHVIGTERHESRRIDNQLRGRSGRQGDKGSTRFFIGLDDDLMKMFAGDTTMAILSKLGMKEGDAIEHPILSKSVERAQRKVEETNFQRRKHILEYDEVREHQRQRFYGLRQRVLEGRDMRGLLFGWIGESVNDAVKEYLDPGYGAKSIAEFVRAKTDCVLAEGRLRGLDATELDKRIRQECKEEIRSVIAITVGEYLPHAEGDGPSVDLDLPGLMKWARERHGVEFTQAELENSNLDWTSLRRMVVDRLHEAASRHIDEMDLSGAAPFLEPHHGHAELCRWAKNKFNIDLEPAAVTAAAAEGHEKVEALVLQRAETLYREREIKFPVEFMMDMTKMMAQQSSPQAALGQLATWANIRFGVEWSVEHIAKTLGPAGSRDALMKLSEQFVAEGKLEKAVQEAMACATDADLAALFKRRYNIELPEAMRYLEGAERADAIRSKVESILRAELLYLERTMLLEVLDDIWKGHLYQMDQIQDAIHFRAFSQQDPRYEFKREGSRLMNETLQAIRDRVTDYIFKVRISPQPPAAPQPARMPGPAMPRPAAAPGGGAGGGASGGAPRNDPYYSPPSTGGGQGTA